MKTTMRQKIEQAAKKHYPGNKLRQEAFAAGAKWVFDYLGNLPLDKAIEAIAEFERSELND